MKSTVAFVLAAAALLFPAPAAQAQPFPGGRFLPHYVSFSGGAYVPEGDLHDRDADVGFAALLNSGYMPNPFFGLQMDVGYFETSGKDHLKVSAVPVSLSMKFSFPIAFLEPYLLGGGGVYFTSTTHEWDGVEVDDSSSEFAPHAAAGVNLNLGRLQFGAEARYVWLEAANINQDNLLVLVKIGTRY